MKIQIEVDSLAELAAVGAMIRGEPLDDGTIGKLHAISRSLKLSTDALASEVETAPKP